MDSKFALRYGVCEASNGRQDKVLHVSNDEQTLIGGFGSRNGPRAHVVILVNMPPVFLPDHISRHRDGLTNLKS
jgi:hypothetical protein